MTPSRRLSTIGRSGIGRWAPVLIWYALILAASSVSGDGLSRFPFEPPDKLVHAGEYAILGLLLVRQRVVRPSASTVRTVLGAVIVVAVLGAIDEIYQGFVPARTPSVADWIADVSGAAVGAWFATRLRRQASPPVPAADERSRGPR